MKIHYYLLDNPITPDPNDRRAQISGYETVSEKDIFDYITRKGSAITTAEVKANYEEIIGAIEFFLRQGYCISTEFIIIIPFISGVFRDDDDKFENGRHRIKFSARLGRRYNSTADDVKVEKIAPPSNRPLPVSFEDISSSTINDNVTPGGVASLTGIRLKFNQADPQQGIFLIGSTKTVYRAERILSHTGKKIIFRLPAGLPSDEYTLEVRALLKGNKDVKAGALADKLTV
jgi:hypothetical protein